MLVLIGVLVVLWLRPNPRLPRSEKHRAGAKTGVSRAGKPTPKLESESPPSFELKFTLAEKHTSPITSLAGSSRYAVSLR